MQLLYDNYDAVTQRSTTIERDSETGLPVIVHTQNTTPILDANKRMAAAYDPHVRRSVRHVARIPAVIWAQWARLGITRDPVALARLLESRECRALRVDNGGPI
jgi:hypothetical protein